MNSDQIKDSSDINEILIGNNIKKKLKMLNHINIMKLHLSSNTTPPSLFFNRFPQPFFPDSQDFVNRHNNRITQFQIDTINDIISTCNQKITECENKILNNLQEDKMNQIITDIQIKKDLELKPGFQKRTEAATRCIAKPFETRIFSQDNTNNNINNTNTSNNSINSNYSGYSHRSNNRSVYNNNNNNYNNRNNKNFNYNQFNNNNKYHSTPKSILRNNQQNFQRVRFQNQVK